jgi:hypothetical protein
MKKKKHPSRTCPWIYFAMEPSHHSSSQATATIFSFCHLNRSPHPQATTPPTNTNSQVTYSHDNSIIVNQHSSSANKQHISHPISQQHAYQDTTDSHASKADTSPLHSHGSTTSQKRSTTDQFLSAATRPILVLLVWNLIERDVKKFGSLLPNPTASFTVPFHSFFIYFLCLVVTFFHIDL